MILSDGAVVAEGQWTCKYRHLPWLLLLAINFPAIPVLAQSLVCPPRGAYPMPMLSISARQTMEQQLTNVQRQVASDPTNPEHLIWLGRRLAYLGRYHDAIEVFSIGYQLHPLDARFLRHRGHRWITLRCLDSAVSDLRKAAALVRRQADMTEPDGIPNDRNIPTSTLKSNIWYHLGLALYLKRDDKAALQAWKQCLRVSRNNDMFVATANWYHLTLLRLGRQRTASRFLAKVDPGMDLMENHDYLEILRLYQLSTSQEDVMKAFRSREGLSTASFGYGLGCYLLHRGQKEAAREVFKSILDTSPWGSFGFMAAEYELIRWDEAPHLRLTR